MGQGRWPHRDSRAPPVGRRTNRWPALTLAPKRRGSDNSSHLAQQSAHSPQNTRSRPSHPIATSHQKARSATHSEDPRRSPTRPITRRPRRPDPASLDRTRSVCRRPVRRCHGPGAVVFGPGAVVFRAWCGPAPGRLACARRARALSAGQLASGPGQTAEASSRSGAGRRRGRTGTVHVRSPATAVHGAGAPV